MGANFASRRIALWIGSKIAVVIIVRRRSSNAIPSPAVHVAALAIARSVLLTSLCWTQLTRSRWAVLFLAEPARWIQLWLTRMLKLHAATTRVADPLKVWAASGSYHLRGACFSVLPASAWAYLCQCIEPR